MRRQLGLAESYHLHSACSQCITYFSGFTVHAPYGLIFQPYFSAPLFLSPTRHILQYTEQYKKDSLPTDKHACTQGLDKTWICNSQNSLKENPNKILDGTLKPG